MKRGKRSAGGRADGERPPAAELSHPERFQWIVDGHNAIFAMAEFEELQTGGHKREARQALEERLESFGRAIGRQVLIVYDGNRIERNPDAVAYPHVRTEYSLAPEEADDRIRFLVQRALADGALPLVVTSDRRSLSSSLPPGARHLTVEEFFRRVVPARLRRPEKWKPGAMEDLEQFFLSQSPYEEDRRLARPDQGDTPSGDGLSERHP